MKIILIFLALLINSSCYEMKTAATDIKILEQNQITNSDSILLKNTGRNDYFVYDFVFVNDEDIYGVGVGPKSGKIYTSNNLGKSWQQEEIPCVSGCTMHAITKNKGILYLTDSGGSVWSNEQSDWKKVYNSGDPEYSPETEFTYLQFANDLLGFAVNRTETGVKIFKSLNGGKKWTKIYEKEMTGNPFNLLVIDENTVILAMNDEYILRTEDGGKTWKPQELEDTGKKIKENGWVFLKDNGASELTTNSDGGVWVTGEKGSLYHSEDKGKNWNRPDNLPGSIKNQQLISIAFSAEGKGIAVGEDGYIITSKDNGKSWNEIDENTRQKNILTNVVTKNLDKLVKVKFKDEKAIILGDRGVYELNF